MIVTIHPSKLSGILQAAASKSSMQRACAAALLAQGETTVKNPGHSNDDNASISVINALGATIESLQGGDLKISSRGIAPKGDSVNCGESGLGIRMFAPIISLSTKEITIEGDGSLRTRPMDFFDEVLPQLSVSVSSNAGKLPLKVKGPLKPANIEIDGSLSSQFLTGILMAFAAADASDVTIKVKNLKSRPYIDLTLLVMEKFGMKVPRNNNYESFYFSPEPGINSQSVTREYTVEGDWSGGAFPLVAGAIAGPIVVKGLDPYSTQADKAILQALMASEAGLSIKLESIEVQPGILKAFHFNATDCPDLFPPLVALAANCKGTTAIEGVKRLAHKESNRALTLQDEFGKMGLEIELQDDLMLIHGGNGLKGAQVHSRHDHRIAMACAVAALNAAGETTIEDAEAVNKSYPDFYSHLISLGADLKFLELSK